MGAWVGPLVTALGALSGAANSGDREVHSESRPLYDPQQMAFRNYLINAFQSRAQSSPVFNNAYKIAGLNNINTNSNNLANTIDATLTARGLGRTTGGASTLRDTAYAGGNAATNFNNQSILDLDARQGQLLKDAGSFSSSLPTGTVGTNIMQGDRIGGAVAGGTSSLAGYLGQLQAQSSLSKILKSLQPANSSGLGSTGADLFNNVLRDLPQTMPGSGGKTPAPTYGVPTYMYPGISLAGGYGHG